MLQNSKGRLK